MSVELNVLPSRRVLRHMAITVNGAYRKGARHGRGGYIVHGKRVCWKGQTARGGLGRLSIAEVTLLLSDMRLTDIGKEARVCSAATCKMRASLAKAQVSIDRKSYV